MSDSRFDGARLLDDLRVRCGDSEFGYRIQGFFGHVILRIGGQVLANNALGHPDIDAILSGERTYFQVKSVKHGSALPVFELGDADYHGVSVTGASGFLAVLDCAAPIGWLLIPQCRLASFVNRGIHLATLRAEADEALSSECSEAFSRILVEHGDRLARFTFAILRDRACRGESL